MKKHTLKGLTIVLAVVLVLSVTSSAFAATLTIDNHGTSVRAYGLGANATGAAQKKCTNVSDATASVNSVLTGCMNSYHRAAVYSPTGWTNPYRVRVLGYSMVYPSQDIVSSSASNGYKVRTLQHALVGRGKMSASQCDGAWGTQTKNALISFQSSYSLTPDGQCGKMTWGKLFDM